MKKIVPRLSRTPRVTSCPANAPPPACFSQSDIGRRSELARLLPLWPQEIADLSIAGRRHIIATLEKALRGERRRGRAGHWAYDLARHAALLKSWRCESESLRDAQMQASRQKENSPPKGGPF